MERCKGLHCLLLIHLIMTSLCLGRIGLSSLSGLCGGLRCVEFFCCLGRNTKQMKNLRAAAPLLGIFEEGGTSKGQKLWMVQTCQNWPDEESCDTFCLQACRAFDIFFFFSSVGRSVTRCGYLLPLYLSCPHLLCVRALIPCTVGSVLHFSRLSPSVLLCMRYIGVTTNSAVLPRALFLLISAICFPPQECAPLWPLCLIRFISFPRSLSPLSLT